MTNTLIEHRKIDSSVTVRLSEKDHRELQEIARRIGCKVSQLTRYAIKKHILAAKEQFENNPDVWK